MMSRFCKSALSILLLSVSSLAAQTALPQGATPPAATPAEKKAKEGYFRFWNLLPKEAGDLQLVQDGPGDGTPLLTGEPLNYYASYVPMKPGRYALKVVRTADPKTPLKTFDVILKGDVYVTFLARVTDGKASFEMVDDTFDPEKTLAGKLTVRQCVPNATVTVSSAAAPATPPLNAGEERVLENLPLQPVFFQLQARMADGKVRNWACEVDFKNSRRVSLWLVQDSHGRFRPRMSPDGQFEVKYTEK